MQEAIRHGSRADDRPTRMEIGPAARSLVERHSGQLIATARRYSLSAEDAEDARWLKERRKKPMSFRTLEEFLAERAARA